MTNKEAIEVLNHSPLVDIGESLVRQAFALAITALREKAEKERRFVVEKNANFAGHTIIDKTRGIAVATSIKTEADAQRIADIYEEMYK